MAKYSNITLENSEQESAFDSFWQSLPGILKEAEYDELYGHQLTAEGEFYNEEIAVVLLLKFIKANEFDVEKSKEQLVTTLKWRREFNPLKAGFGEDHGDKFDNVVVLARYDEEIVTWNLYNAHDGVKPKDLFKDLDAFLRFRSGVMERSIQLLDLTGEKTSYMIQVHDYEGVSFLKFDPDIKRGSKATIKLFQDNYPEILKQKLFVNVPVIMTWVYSLVTAWLPKQTTRKFVMLSNSSDTVKYLGEGVPKRYGGKGEELVKQAIKDVKPTEYGARLLQDQFTNEVD